MPFVNELISAADFAAERFGDIDRRFEVGASNADEWTIDRERGLFLRLLTVGREDWANRSDWFLGVSGHRYVVRTELVDYAGARGGHGVARYAVTMVNGKSPHELPADQRRTLLEVLGEALTAYGDDGLHSTCATFEAHVVAQGATA